MRLVSDSTVLSGSLSDHTARVSELLLLPAHSPMREASSCLSQSHKKKNWWQSYRMNSREQIP